MNEEARQNMAYKGVTLLGTPAAILTIWGFMRGHAPFIAWEGIEVYAAWKMDEIIRKGLYDTKAHNKS